MGRFTSVERPIFIPCVVEVIAVLKLFCLRPEELAVFRFYEANEGLGHR